MPKLNIKAKLCLIILVMLIPLLAVQAYSISSRFHSFIDFEMQANEDFASAVGLIFKNHISHISEDIYQIGKTIAASPGLSAGEISTYLESCSKENHAVQQMLWVDPEGTILASSYQGGIGNSLRDREHYQRIIAGADLAVSEVLIGRSTNEPVVAITRAIREGNELVGLLTASLDMETLASIMPEQRVSSANSFGLADHKGIVVYREGYPQIIRHMIEVNPQGTVRKVLASGQPARDKKVYSAVTNTYLSSTAVPIPACGWVAYANSDYGEIMRLATKSIKYNVLVLFSGTLIALYCAFRLSRTIMKPINNLQHFAAQLGGGNLDVRTSIGGTDELALTGAALNEMASRIRQLETSRRLFIQSSAHELRNPLAGIRGIVSLLRRRLATGSGVDDHMLALAEKEVDRLASIINQLLETFKEQNQNLNGSSYKWGLVDLAEILKEVTSAFTAILDEQNIVLELQEGPRALVRGDASRLADVLRNLLGNAIKYTAATGITEPATIVIRLAVEQRSALITVQDEGIGIPEEHLEDIFESFFRAENYGGKDPGGMGLGLYLSKEIILKHGGRIRAVNNPDQGSIFSVELPLYQEGGAKDNETHPGD